jgi:hypothetical protein
LTTFDLHNFPSFFFFSIGLGGICILTTCIAVGKQCNIPHEMEATSVKTSVKSEKERDRDRRERGVRRGQRHESAPHQPALYEG